MASNGDIPTRNSYFFYHIFKFIGSFTLFLSILSLIGLVYNVCKLKGVIG